MIQEEEEEAVCRFCGSNVETIDHVLLHCDYVWRVWAECLRWCGIQWVVHGSVKKPVGLVE